jgi:HSP20 family molecular chaperone IbpA
MNTLSILNRMNKLVTDKDWYANTWPSPNHHESDTLNRFVEEKGSFKLKLNIAGADKESINVSHEDNMLIVLAKCEEDNIDYHYRCHLPSEKADVKKAKAKYENGILNLTIPKHAKAKSLSIKID